MPLPPTSPPYTYRKNRTWRRHGGRGMVEVVEVTVAVVTCNHVGDGSGSGGVAHIAVISCLCKGGDGGGGP